MDANKQLNHWKILVYSVFKAEDAIKDKWVDILKTTKNMDKDSKAKVADEYVTAIAKEILSKTNAKK